VLVEPTTAVRPVQPGVLGPWMAWPPLPVTPHPAGIASSTASQRVEGKRVVMEWFRSLVK
jgi:hypothetical protein